MAEDSDAAFMVEFHDKVYDSKKSFILSFYSRDQTLSLYDVNMKRFFLRRTQPDEQVKLSDLYIGTTVVVCGRALKVYDYADESTRRKFASTRGAALVIVKPSTFRSAGAVLERVTATAGVQVGRLRTVHFTPAQANEFLSLSKKPVSNADVSYMSSGTMLAMEVAGDDIMAIVHSLVGPADPADAQQAAPRSLRAELGRTRVHNGVHVSASLESARAEIAFVLESRLPATGTYNRCAVVLVKPHGVSRGLAGPVLSRVLAQAEGLEVTAVRSVVLSREDAADFLEHYKGVCAEYGRWVVELSSGPSLAIEVRPLGVDEDSDAVAEAERAVESVRALAGPFDPAIAKALRPSSFRGLWGQDTLYNIVHVTDLPRDGPLESKFLFEVME